MPLNKIHKIPILRHYDVGIPAVLVRRFQHPRTREDQIAVSDCFQSKLPFKPRAERRRQLTIQP